MSVSFIADFSLGGPTYSHRGRLVVDDLGQKVGEFAGENLARQAALALNAARAIHAAAHDEDGAEIERAAMQSIVDEWDVAP